MTLSQLIAQRIVERVMTGLNQPVSVTDRAARVLASSDPQLVGQPLALAAEAIRSGDLASAAQGGMSLPLTVGATLVGAIVLADSPEHGPDLARLARALAEGVLRQPQASEPPPPQQRTPDLLLTDLLYGQMQGAAEAARLGIDPDQAHIVVALDVGAHEHATEQARQQLIDLARQLLPSEEGDIYGFVNEHLLVMLASVNPAHPECRRRQLARDVQRLLDRLAVEHGAPASASIGRAYHGWAGPSHSFADARCALASGVELDGAGRVFLIEALGLASFVCGSDQQHKQALAQRLLEPIAAEPDLLVTLVAFLHDNLSPSLAAQTLHIHRHTLAYRLDKIARITGFDPRQFEAASQLAAALLLWKVDALPSYAPGSASS